MIISILECLSQIIKDTNNREWAILFWISFYILFICFRNSDIRTSFYHLIKSLFATKLIISMIIVYAYMLFAIYIMYHNKLFHIYNAKDICLWLFLIPIPTSTQFITKKDNNYEHLAYNVFSINSIIFFVQNIYVFPLLIEILLFPIIVFIYLLLAYSEQNRKYIEVHKCLNAILVLGNLAVFSYNIYSLCTNWDIIIEGHQIDSFFIEFILTLIYLPMLYFYCVYAEYEYWFVRIKYCSPDMQTYRQRKLYLLKKCGIKLSFIRHMHKRLHVYTTQSWNQFQTDFENLASTIIS